MIYDNIIIICEFTVEQMITMGMTRHVVRPLERNVYTQRNCVSDERFTIPRSVGERWTKQFYDNITADCLSHCPHSGRKFWKFTLFLFAGKFIHL